MIYQLTTTEWVNFDEVAHLSYNKQGIVSIVFKGCEHRKKLTPENTQDLLGVWATYARVKRIEFIRTQRDADTFYEEVLAPEAKEEAKRNDEAAKKAEEARAAAAETTDTKETTTDTQAATTETPETTEEATEETPETAETTT